MANSSQQFYKLQADPFRLGPDHHFSFPHKTYKKALADLKLALVGKEAFIVITGRPGTGKTTLLSEAIAQLDASKVVMANLLTTRFEAHDLRSMVASSFGLNCSKVSNSDISSELENFLQMRHSEGKRAFLVIDDAQRLGEGVLEELQLLTNLQEHGKPLLKIILVGPEELTDSIHSLEPEDTGKRMISSSQLEPLSESETIDYIAHRLNRAGWKGDPEITIAAGFLVHHFSGGIAGTINRICHRFLLYGCAEEKHRLDADDMRSVLEELSEEQLVSLNTAVLSDLEEKISRLEKESIQALRKIKKTSIETLITKDDDAVIQVDTRHQSPVNFARHIEDLLSRQDSHTATKTSGTAENPGGFNKPASTTDEITDNVSAENNSCGDTRHSNDESQVHTETTAIDSPTSPRERSRWPGNFVWLAVLAVIVVAVGLKIYSGAPQGHTQIQSQAEIVSRSPVHQTQLAERTPLDTVPANDNSMHDNKVKNDAAPIRKNLDISTYDGENTGNNRDVKERHLNRLETGPERINETAQSRSDVANMRRTNSSADKPEAATGTSKTTTVAAVKPVEPRQAKIHEVTTDTALALTETTPGLIPARTVKTAPPIIAKPAEPTGEKPSATETNTATDPVPQQPLKTTTAPDISAEPIETTQIAASGKYALPDKVEPAEPTGEKSSVTETKPATDPVPQQPMKTTTAPDIATETVETTQVAASTESALPGKTETSVLNQSRTAPSEQASKPLAQPSPKVPVTTETPTLKKTDPVIVQSEKSSKPAAKKPQKARGTRAVKKSAGSASQTMDTLLKNQWITNTRQQAALLPSFLTNCSVKSGGVECWSGEHFIDKNEKSIGVKTKSYLRRFTKTGFTIRYKHMLLGGANEKRRWEDQTHQLDCVITNGNKIKCREDGNNGAVIFTRNSR